MSAGIELAHRLFETNCRIEGIWPIPNGEVPEAMLEAFEYNERLPEALTPFVKGWDEDETAQLFDGDGGVARDAWNELFCAMYNAGTLLYVALASVPVFTRSSDNSASFSWGHYSSDVHIADTPLGAIEGAIAAAEAEYANAKVPA